MNKEDIQRTVDNFLVEEFEISPEKVKGDASLKKDLAIDSLDIVDVIVLIEKEFGVKVKSEELSSLGTLNDLYDLIDKKLS